MVIHTFFLPILLPGNLNNDSSQQYVFLPNMKMFQIYLACM